MASRSNARLQHDLLALEQSAERAGLALACAFSNYQDYEAAIVRTRRYRRAVDLRRIGELRVILGITAGVCALALIALAF
jgi:hypothetical protein